MQRPFLYHRKLLRNFPVIQKPSGQDRTAAERYHVAKATRRRRRILQSRILFYHIYDSVIGLCFPQGAVEALLTNWGRSRVSLMETLLMRDSNVK